MKLRQLVRRVILLMLVPLVVTTGVAAYLSKRYQTEEQARALAHQAEMASERFVQALNNAASVVSLLSLLEPGRERCSAALGAVHQSFAATYSVIAVADPDGRLLCASPRAAVGQDVSDRAWFSRVRESGSAAYGGYQISRSTGEPALVVARPVALARGERRNYAGVAMRLESLTALIAAGAGNAGAGVAITDRSGVVLASTLDDAPLGTRLDVPAREGLAAGELAGAARKMFVMNAPIGEGAFRIIAAAPRDGLPAVTRQILITGLLLALLGSVVISGVAFGRMERRVLLPIERMRRMAPRVARGEAEEIEQAPHAPEELRRVTDAFNEMAATVRAQRVALDQAFDLGQLGTWTIQADLESVRASSHIREVLGLPDEIVQLDHLRQRILAEDRDAFDEALRQAVTERRMAEVEFRALNAQAEVRVFRAVTGPGGAVPRGGEPGISGIIQDITELRRNEAALAQSVALQRLAGEAARIGGWRYEVATRRLTGTPKAARLAGFAADANITLEDLVARFADDARERIERGFWGCVGAGIPFDEIAKFRRMGGEETWMRAIGEAERDETGAVIAVHGALQDVGEVVSVREASEELRTLLQTILDSLGDGFLVQDRDGSIRYMNRRAHTILGVPDEDLVGRNIWEELPDAIGTPFERAVLEAMETGESRSHEGQVGPAGRWIVLTVHPTPAGIACYLSDVTRERRMRARLRLLGAAVSRLNDMIVITEAEPVGEPGPRIVYVNEAFEKISGYSREEAIGATPRMLQGPETERERLDEVREALEHQRRVRTELTNYRKDGSRFTLEVDINPLFDADGRCTHYVAVQRDTTERRAAEERLQAREEQFRLVSMASKDVIWDWDMQEAAIWRSDNYAEVFGREPEDARTLEKTLEWIHPEDRLAYTESLDAALAGDGHSWRCEYRMEAEGGAYRMISDRGFIVREASGAPRRMVGAMSDVTEFRSLDAQLHQAQKLESVGQLTGGIAHDFNNLLTIILGNCDMLLDAREDPALGRIVRSIEEAAERGARLSSDLLAFSRRQPLSPRPTDVNELVRRSAGLFNRAVPASIDVRYDLTDAPTVAMVDPDKLQNGLLNLVLNAEGAIEGEGCIVVRTGRAVVEDGDRRYDCPPGDYVEIAVADDGGGMTADVAERAFEPFFTTKGLGVGTGLGLSSVYGLVKQSGGHVDLETEPGRGTTVTLCLPLAAEADAEEREQTEPAGRAGRGEGQRILVVEDDAELRAYVRTALTNMGYRVDVAEMAEKALEQLAAGEPFDLLLTDVVMPGRLNGLQLADEVQERRPGVRVLFMSGYARDAMPTDGRFPGEAPVLYKPFRTVDLAEAVQEALAGSPQV